MKNDDDRPKAPPPDKVDEASEESFPASDPPSWDPSHTGAPAHPKEQRPQEQGDGDDEPRNPEG